MRLDPVAVKVWVLSPAFCCGNLSPSRLQMPMNPIHEKKSCCGGHNRSAEAEVKPSSGAKYFCPMCPGVESEKPSDCPKCGMGLERNPLIPDDGEDHEIRALTRKFWIATALTLPVFFLAMAHMIPGVHLQKDITKWIEFILTIPVLWAGGMFFTKAWVSLKTWNLNMFTLIATGVGAAFIHSSIAVLAPGLFPESFKEHGEVGLYFEASAVITVLVLLGQLLEAKARARTGEAIQALMGLAAKTAHRLCDGNEEDVPIDEIKKGDLLRVRSGEKVPIDGTIILFLRQIVSLLAVPRGERRRVGGMTKVQNRFPDKLQFQTNCNWDDLVAPCDLLARLLERFSFLSPSVETLV